MSEDALEIKGYLPRCRTCGQYSRPNIMMFWDYEWNSNRTERQRVFFDRWLENINHKELVVIEIGAGTVITSIQSRSNSLKAPVIRINPDKKHCAVKNDNGVSIDQCALEALEGIEDAMARLNSVGQGVI